MCVRGMYGCAVVFRCLGISCSYADKRTSKFSIGVCHTDSVVNRLASLPFRKFKIGFVCDGQVDDYAS